VRDGQLRGLVRSLRGGAIDADVQVTPAGGAAGEPRALRAEAGRFTLDLPSGAYDVRIVARGHETQKRRVQIEPDGVTLLNIDLRVSR